MDGVLVVNKESGMTSHDVVDLIRRRFNLKKVGHAGTLDPMATGVLVMLIGSYTKISGQFMSEEKEYEGSLVLGASSDTLDAWGKMTPSGKSTDFTNDKVIAAFKNFLGESEQFPPMYSSVKINGQKLYEFARKGLTVTVQPRKILVKNIEVTKIALPEVFFKVTCSKGTYVRALCADIGENLGCSAHMAQLNRTRSGKFTIDKAIEIDELRRMKVTDLEKALIYPYESNTRF